MKEYGSLTNRKIQLYFACNYLYAKSKSHPQVIEILSAYEPDLELLTHIADAAAVDRWRVIFNEAQRLTSLGKNFEEIVDAVKSMEPDPEIIHFICNTWYGVQAMYAENVIESPTHIRTGITITIICSLGFAFMLITNASNFSKIIWGLGILPGLITLAYGLSQKKLAKGLKDVLEKDYTQFGKII